MIENETSEQETRLPAQQAQQPQAATEASDRAAAGNRKRAEDGILDGASNAAIDDARFSAGVVKLYEALLKEPIPEEMLRLVEELSKQERT